jgi:serine phosphatase RsbU (regulator of sigma subunit)
LIEPPVTRKQSSTLTLHSPARTETKRPTTTESPAVAELCHAFEQTTGWTLALKDSGLSGQPFSLSVSATVHKPALHRAAAATLASAMCGVLAEFDQARAAVWQREAELAAGVPIAARPQEEQHLAERLEAVLAGGAEAVGCQAAALYLLDDATSQLKLRACWNLPHEKLLEPARPLRGAIADLEALVGHAVVIEDTSLLPHWHVPENFPSAVCVPVSSPSTPLGTLWLFADRERDFTSHETNLVEIVAGRIASDLERELLLSEGVQAKRVQLQWNGAVQWQQQRLPKTAPLVEGWQAAGWTSQADGIGGDFYDWTMHDDGRLAIAVGDAHGAMLQAGLTAAVAQGSLRSHVTYAHEPQMLLSRINKTLWTNSTGDEFASFFYGLVDPTSGELACSLAGSASLLLIRGGESEFITTDTLPLGALPETEFPVWRRRLQAGDVLVAMSEGVLQARDDGGLLLGEAAITTLIRRAAGLPAGELAERIRELVESHCPKRLGLDRTALVLKRRR